MDASRESFTVVGLHPAGGLKLFEVSGDAEGERCTFALEEFSRWGDFRFGDRRFFSRRFSWCFLGRRSFRFCRGFLSLCFFSRSCFLFGRSYLFFGRSRFFGRSLFGGSFCFGFFLLLLGRFGWRRRVLLALAESLQGGLNALKREGLMAGRRARIDGAAGRLVVGVPT